MITIFCDPCFWCFPATFTTQQVVASFSTANPGFNAGGGLEVRLGHSRARAFAEARYQRISTTHGEDLMFTPVTFGLRWWMARRAVHQPQLKQYSVTCVRRSRQLRNVRSLCHTREVQPVRAMNAVQDWENRQCDLPADVMADARFAEFVKSPQFEELKLWLADRKK